MRRFWNDNALSVVLLILFVAFWLAQALSGWAVHNEELQETRQRTLPFMAYLGSSHFWAATAENWESEFLQMGSFVMLTVYLRQRGSAESNPLPDETSEDARPEEKGGSFWRRNSLTLVLFALFLLSLILHFFSAYRDYNLEQLTRGQEAVGPGEFLGKPDFWFQSFQNWQSEFLAVAAIVVLTIFLRQVGSSQSKRLDDPNDKTGG